MKYQINAINLIKEADAVAIFAGAGMSVDSGLNPFRGE
jgi:NAD-dependent SIR2 family protein deacetylase